MSCIYILVLSDLHIEFKVASPMSCQKGTGRVPSSIDPSHKSCNASDQYPTMHYFVTEMYTFLLQNSALWDISLMHCGISELGQYTWVFSWCIIYEMSPMGCTCTDLLHFEMPPLPVIPFYTEHNKGQGHWWRQWGEWHLIQWGLNKMADILQIFGNAVSWNVLDFDFSFNEFCYKEFT